MYSKRIEDIDYPLITRSFSAHSVDRIVTEPKWRRRGGGFPSGGQQAGDGIVGGCYAFRSGEVGQRGLDVSLWQGVGELYQMARVPYLLACLSCRRGVWLWGVFWVSKLSTSC